MTTKIKRENILQLQSIRPKTRNQNRIFEAFKTKNLFITGCAGTGKSFISLYLALCAIEAREYDRVIIIRSAVPSRTQGFLPGTEDEKNEIFELPYVALVASLFKKDDAYKQLKHRGTIEFMSTSYLRGLTLENAVIIIDEVQNMNLGEINTVITRTGEGCKVIICGDEAQNDLEYQREDSCIDRLHRTVYNMPSFAKIEMTVEDICRNKIVREWIEALGC